MQGYYGTNAEIGGQCNQCPSGTNTTAPSNSVQGNTNSQANVSVCNQCSLNFYMNTAANPSNPISSAQCTACPQGSGTQIASITPTDVSFCNVCVANYYMTVAAFSPIPGVKAYPAICMPCPANSSCPVQTKIGTLVNCTCYDENALPFSTSQVTCTCLNGYYGNVSSLLGGPSGCTRCPQGMFSIGGTPCQNCPPGSQILNDFSGCTCFDNSTGTLPWSFNTNQCQCSAGYYGDPSTATSGTTGSCTPCPSGYTSITGVARQQSDCFLSGMTFGVVIRFYVAISICILILL
ncbi:GCC2 and GCC3 family protein (macronuclear) [Tetrahymena thermophila SB210]|uniref:GCC2 and GCC3 family protein n=1 Tax=Tetrahymena thermophila (strain SB210) TaxID=312017 RepID=Q22PD3_TETTS|nr:GCC2 and GCC3 family protein [Tetrahymena thermophila SB210]EAR87176.2 GCC2 and GCC3 family protein [Tetrahymena thermophila SB210]|eukprot:XP_001007421.2 GCC2 and GCC3 family protein [Tetrahymena thermophila SB210]